MTELSQAIARALDAPEDGAARRAVLRAIMAADLVVTDGGAPELIETPDGSFAPAFDGEERIATRHVVERVLVPGRVLISALADQGAGLWLNPGTTGAFPVEAATVGWLNEVASEVAAAKETAPQGQLAPPREPDALLAALDTALSRMQGLARHAWLAEAGGVPLLVIVGAAPGAEDAMARVISDAVRLSDWEGDLQLGFSEGTDDAALARVALRIEVPQGPSIERPETPPRLRQ